MNTAGHKYVAAREWVVTALCDDPLVKINNGTIKADESCVARKLWAIWCNSCQEKGCPLYRIVLRVDSNRDQSKRIGMHQKVRKPYDVRLDVVSDVNGSSSVLLIVTGLPEQQIKKKRVVMRVQKVDSCIFTRTLDDSDIIGIMTHRKA